MPNLSNEQIQKIYQYQQQAYSGAKFFYYTFIIFGLILDFITIIINYPKFSFLNLIWIIFHFSCSIYNYKKCNQIVSFVEFKQLEEYSNNQISNIKNDQSNYPKKFYCKYCQAERSYRIKHCVKCKSCIYKFDHHCFWIGTCVGQLNHKYFYYFLFFQTNVNLYFCIILNRYLDLNNSFYWVYMVLEILSIGFLLFTTYLLLYHSLLIITNQTTWQQMKRQKISYLNYLPKGYNPFSLGFYENIKYFFLDKQIPKQWKVPSYEQAKRIKPGFNICQNQYYSCC